MDQLIENITNEQIYLLKQHLELFLTGLKQQSQQTANKQSNFFEKEKLFTKIENLCQKKSKEQSQCKFLYKNSLQDFSLNTVNQSCFWSYQTLATLALQLVEKVRINLINIQQYQIRQQDINYENEALKKKIIQLKQSLQRINDFHQKNQQVFEALIEEKENNSKVLIGALSENQNELNLNNSFQGCGSANKSFNCNTNGNYFNKDGQSDSLKRILSSKQSQIKSNNQKIKQLESQVYCLTLQLNVLRSENQELVTKNITLSKNYQGKCADYQFLLEKAEAYLQELNFFRLPDKLQGEQEFQMYKLGDLFRKESENYLKDSVNQVKDCDQSQPFEVPRLIGLRQNDAEEFDPLQYENQDNSYFQHYHVSVDSKSYEIDQKDARVSLRKDLVALIGENQESLYFHNNISDQGISCTINSNRQHRRGFSTQRSFSKVSICNNKKHVKQTFQKEVNTQTDLFKNERQFIVSGHNGSQHRCLYCLNRIDLRVEQRQTQTVQQSVLQESDVECMRITEQKHTNKPEIESFTERIFKRINAQPKKIVHNRIKKFKEKERNQYISAYFACER